MKVTKLRNRVRIAATIATLVSAVTIVDAVASPLYPADQEFQLRLFERYDRKQVVNMASGIVVGLDISESLQSNFAVEYTHFDESLTIPERYQRQEQLDERTFGDSDVRSAGFDRLAAGEKLQVSDFYLHGDSIVFYLVSRSITRFGRSPRTGGKSYFGVKFTFVFPLSIMTSGDYDAVVQEINKYFLPLSEFRAASQAAQARSSAPRRVEIQPGMTEDDFIKVLGAPERIVVFGNKTLLTYPDITIELVDNRVVDVKTR